jgi:Domain of unknown function (DUF4389)
MAHPVQLAVEPAGPIPRVHIVIRLALLLALTTLGASSIYWCLYLALPAIVALVVSKKGGARYLAEDAPRVARALRWIATAYGFLWFLSNELPTGDASPVHIQIEPGGTPTVASALLRLVTSLPALLLVAVLSLAGAVVWIVAAVVALVTERLPAALADFLTLTLRVQLRFAAYHLSLVDRYPSLESSELASVRRSTAAS